MSSFSRLGKFALISLGTISGGIAYYRINYEENEKKFNVFNSYTTNYTPAVKWDKNWDFRDPESLVKPPKSDSAADKKAYQEELEKAKSTAWRHIFLIRHGQYNINGACDADQKLTELGKHQAIKTGQRLKLLCIPFKLMVRSTMTRAQETGEIICDQLGLDDLEIHDCQLIEEGAPIPPEPPVGHWKPEAKQFFQEGARIEAGFRRYFYRAPPDQKEDSYTLLVCHANVIRYYVCKALQFPPEAWLRISLNHGSITWISIHPNGNVVLRALGDSGHMDPKCITRRVKKQKKLRKSRQIAMAIA